MVKKLYKHEALALLRCMIPIDFACLALALLSKLSYLLDSSIKGAGIVKGMFTTFYILSIFALFIVGFVIVITRFYRNLLTSEGYMTHTIPVKTSSHLHCKLICGFLFMLFNIIVVLASFLIIGTGSEILDTFFKIVSQSWDALAGSVGLTSMILYVVEVIVVIVLYLFLMIQQPYAAMSMGQKMKNKVGGAVLWYFIFYFIICIFNQLCAFSCYYSNCRFNRRSCISEIISCH